MRYSSARRDGAPAQNGHQTRRGWEELKRLSDEMDATADRIKRGATVDEAVASLEADPTISVLARC